MLFNNKERNKERLILFTRYPEPGKTKTRLIPKLGPLGAALLQQQMTEKCFAVAQKAAAYRKLDLEIRYTGGTISLFKNWLKDPQIILNDQGKGELGERLRLAFIDAFRAHKDRVIIIGSDCPGLSLKIINNAFDHLREKELVLGPANDGGYYLIGLSKPCRDLFANISWGTEKVLPTTLERAQKLGLTIHLLESLSDIDRPEDLKHVNNNPNR